MVVKISSVMSAKEKAKKNQSFNEDCFQDLNACD